MYGDWKSQSNSSQSNNTEEKRGVYNEKSIKRIVSFGLLCSLLTVNICTYSVAHPDEKRNYLVMLSNKRGENNISTVHMTSLEAEKLRSDRGVAIVEDDGIVTGSEFEDDNYDVDSIIEDLLDKDIQKLTQVFKDFVEGETEWNIQQINVDTVGAQETVNTVTGSAIKVAMIDSGVDYNTDTEVFLRKNFIPGQNDVSIIYEDLCGHGTSVAGIIAANDNNEGITGINSNIKLYSAKVLDGNCTSPISRVVEAIYWAISQEVNIINISFGTTTQSAALEKAIKDASNAGILIVASAGNNETVEFPAAYEEVMAVGSVDTMGEVSDFSPSGNDIELVAPGEKIMTTGDFGGISVRSGTSMSAPHVAGVAATLWQKDPSVSAIFIRALLDKSANLYGNKEEYGYGLVDLNYALEIYDNYKEEFVQESEVEKANIDDTNDVSNAEDSIIDNNSEAENSSVIQISDNTNEVVVFDDINYVEGRWTQERHQYYVTSANGYGLKDTDMVKIKAGAVANDLYIGGMTTYPQWHGYWQKKPDTTQIYKSNYIASYICLTRMARKFAG